MSSDSRESLPSQSPYAANRAAVRTSGRTADAIVALVAVMFVLMAASGYFYRQQKVAERGEHLRLMVTGPSSMRVGVAAEYAITTTSMSGAPLPAQIEAAILGRDGKPLRVHNEPADDRGQLSIIIPADLPLPPQVRLKVVARHGGNRAEMDHPLTVEPTAYITQLDVDKPLYRPGETVYYRSLTLNRFGLEPASDALMHFDIRDPKGVVVPHSSADGAAQRGVASGEFKIPADRPNGRYTLTCSRRHVSTSSDVDPASTEQVRHFYIRPYQLPAFDKSLEFAGDSYRPGEKVTAHFSARHVGGRAAAGLPLRITATVYGKVISESQSKTNDAGAAEIEFKLPEKLDRGDGRLAVAVDHGAEPETISEAIPINLGKVEVTFYPEGGELTPDLENRVYFAARSALGRPLHLSGMIVANGRGEKTGGEDVATVDTVVDGKGSFSIIPRAGETYRLKITRPAGVENQPTIPGVSAQRDVVLSVGEGVYAAGEPLAVNIRASKAGRPLAVAAYCRGVQVGEQRLVTHTGVSVANPITIALPRDAAGVIRLIVYDYSTSPPTSVAERLVYRHPSQKLDVKVLGLKERYAPGEMVDMSLGVTNEKGEPAQATLTVAAVNSALWSLAEEPSPTMPTEILLIDELEKRDSAAEDRLLTDRTTEGVPAAVALNLLLATQASQPAVEGHAHEEKGKAAVAASVKDQPPLMFDNMKKIRAKYETALADHRTGQARTLDTLTVTGFFGGLGLVLLVAMLGLMRIAGGVHLWIAAIAAVACCVIAGVILAATVRQSNGRDLPVAYSPYFAPLATTSERAPVEQSRTLVKQTQPIRPNGMERTARTGSAMTLFWNPMLITGADGKASVSFRLPETPGRYRVLVDACDGGRLGSERAEIIVPANP